MALPPPRSDDPQAPDPAPTQVLLDRVRDGDEAALNGLLARHRDAIRRMIDRRMDRVVQHRVDASDIVQDVLLEANRRLGDYLANPTMPFRLWLRHMARDRLIDAHRRHRVAASRSVDREVSLAAPAATDDRSRDDVVGQIADRELTPAAGMRYLRAMRRLRVLLDGGE